MLFLISLRFDQFARSKNNPYYTKSSHSRRSNINAEITIEGIHIFTSYSLFIIPDWLGIRFQHHLNEIRDAL